MSPRIRFLSLCLVWSSSALPAGASVSLQFSNGSSALNNIADQTEQVQSGLLWGVLVDRDDAGFEAFTIDDPSGLNLTNGEELKPGYFLWIGGVTVTQPFGTDFPGPGTIAASNSFDPSEVPGITLSKDAGTGDPTGSSFAVIWFGKRDGTPIASGDALAAGDSYGLLVHPSFRLPAQGDTNVPYLEFTGEDPIRPADQVVGGDATPPPVPMPGIVMIDPGGGGAPAPHFAYTLTASVDYLNATTFELEKSATMAAESWEVIVTGYELVEDNGDSQTVRIVDPDPIGTDAKRFLRLRTTP